MLNSNVSRSASKVSRYDEFNIHSERKTCNSSGKLFKGICIPKCFGFYSYDNLAMFSLALFRITNRDQISNCPKVWSDFLIIKYYTSKI